MKEQTLLQVKKRKLYKQVSGTEVPWFPHDNAPDLLKELCHEAGRPRWVFFGTPAGGAGMHGVLEMGCSVVALCYDEHHRTHLQRFLVERSGEAMVQGTTLVFKDESLQARALDLKLLEKSQTDSGTGTGKAASAKGKDSDDDAGGAGKKAKKKKASGSQKGKPKKSRAKATDGATPKKKRPRSSRSLNQTGANQTGANQKAIQLCRLPQRSRSVSRLPLRLSRFVGFELFVWTWLPKGG